MSASTPPPRGPTPVTPDQTAAIESIIGADAPPELVRALRDARGRTFQRLEFLGDPLLETVEALQSVLSNGEVPQHEGTTDTALARDAQRLGIAQWLEWQPSDQRRADLVEAIAGAAYLTGGWQQVGRVHARIHGTLPTSIALLLEQPARAVTTPDAAQFSSGRPEATLGASILETAATLAAFSLDPEADEGVLSAMRREVHTTRRIAAWGESLGLPHREGQWRTTSDLVEAWLGRTAMTYGPATAVSIAERVLAATTESE